jgi:hypothetical protein
LPSSFSQVRSTSFPLLVTCVGLLACSVPPFTADVEVFSVVFFACRKRLLIDDEQDYEFLLSEITYTEVRKSFSAMNVLEAMASVNVTTRLICQLILLNESHIFQKYIFC